MPTHDRDFTPFNQFAAQLIPQLFADLAGILSADDGTPVANAYEIVTGAALAGSPRAASLIVLLQAAATAHGRLIGDSAVDEGAIGEGLNHLLPAAAARFEILNQSARRLVRYCGEAEPASPSLPFALGDAIERLYRGLANDDAAMSNSGLLGLRTQLVHIDAVASQLDPAVAEDRPIRVFAPHVFHDYFQRLTELVQKAPASDTERAVATLTRDGRLTAVVTASDHPLEAAAEAVRALVPGDPATKEHALLRMQGLLRCVDQLRDSPDHPWADALTDESRYLSLIVAAATAPMAAPGRFAWPPLAQVARYNDRLLRNMRQPPL